MPYIITCSIKILTLATAPFLIFFSVGVLYEFSMVPGVYIVPLSPQEEIKLSSFSWDICIQSVAIHQKYCPLPAIILLCQGYC